MKKSELEQGSLVFMTGNKNVPDGWYILIGKVFHNLEGYGIRPLDMFDEELKNEMYRYEPEWQITKTVNPKRLAPFLKYLAEGKDIKKFIETEYIELKG